MNNYSALADTQTVTTSTTSTTGCRYRCYASPRLSGYRLIRRLGDGGMGVVYLAEEIASGRMCAVKMIRSELASDPRSLARFEREGELLGQIRHPHVVGLLGAPAFGQNPPHFAMELVDGDNLDDLVDCRGPLPSQAVTTILRQLCSALGELHARGLMHGDLKPANVIATLLDDATPNVKLIDFGLTRPFDRAHQSADRLDGGCFTGSPLYAAPETYLGLADSRSDIYSLGAMAYHLLTGRPVFEETQPVAAIMAHAAREPVPVKDVNNDVDALLGEIVMKTLRKDPTERFQSVDELDVALAQIHSVEAYV